MNENTDLKFFTNEPEATLLKRFQKVLQNAEFLDSLVGYFRSSGFFQLYKSLENVKKIRILVGLNVDRITFQMLQEEQKGKGKLIVSSQKAKQGFSEKVKEEIENAVDSKNIEEGIKKFIEFIQSKKLEICVYPEYPIHAKMYIVREDPKKSGDYGRVITGSSNFTESGLVENLEFNVELKDAPDVKFALKKFEELWKKGVDVSEKYVITARNRTWLREDITPYELYLKFLYEYFREKINYDRELFADFPKGILELDYQKEAVADALDKIKQHNGACLSDVVGLGKTFISGLIAKKLGGKSLIICSPVLKDYWEEIFRNLLVAGYRVESHGKLDKLLEQGVEDYENIFIDEAHKFRNEITQSFEMLQKICAGKKVILITATPLNNRPKDIASQLYLFENKYNSTIPGLKNLYHFFSRTEKQLAPSLSKEEYLEKAKQISERIRERILKYVMVRRTRKDIEKYFPQDLRKQDIKFPEVKTPKKLFYQLDENLNQLFEETLKKHKLEIKYARYNPFFYLTDTAISKLPKEESQLQRVSQSNLYSFMKVLFVKRLESSFYAFCQTLRRFTDSYQKFIEMYNNGAVYMSKEVNIYDLLESGNEDEIQKLVEEGKAVKYLSKDFKPEFRRSLEKDKVIFESLYNKWSKVVAEGNDPKIELLKSQFEKDKILQDSQIIIFSESKETGEYLKKNLSEIFSKKVMFVSSDYSKGDVEKIKRNFDLTSKIKENKLKILIATDVLSEGVNLHRANIIINYDIPWNSIRILQRVGRVNRIGSRKDIYIYNFFPTERAEKEIQLEKLAVAKIQAFQNALGEDARYLSPEKEIPDSFHLFNRINSKVLFEEEAEDNELNFLEQIRKIRDKQPELFERIKKLPKKARTIREEKELSPSLLTFFRQGYLKKFFLSSKKSTKELDFLEAAKILKTTESEIKKKLDLELYYQFLDKNKVEFQKAVEEEELPFSKRSATTENRAVQIIKALENSLGLVEEDEEYLRRIKEALEEGAIAKKTLLKIIKLAKAHIKEPIKIFSVVRENIPEQYLDALLVKNKGRSHNPKEIILSEFFI
ncbi:MAG: helicase-related protein [Elusimicrobiota bacterium]